MRRRLALLVSGATSYTSIQVLTASGTGPGGLARHTMTRVTPIVVGDGQHVELVLTRATSRTGLCAAEVVYSLPAAP